MSAEAWIGLAGAVAGGLLTAVVSGWLNSRAQVAEELREQRLKVYPPIWLATGIVSRWPQRDETTYGAVSRFHHELRDWYYATGGLFLSANARRRYGHLQEMAGRVTALGSRDARLDAEDYRLLRDACSALRTALTEDLESRRQRSLLVAIPLGLRHVAERMHASRRDAAMRDREAAVAVEPRAQAAVPPAS